MSNPNEPQHKTRDHRFAYISTGDITRWARGTSKFVYPEPKNIKSAAIAITSKAACALKPIARKAAAQTICMVGMVDKDKTVSQEIEAAGRRADVIDSGLAIADTLNRRFGLLK